MTARILVCGSRHWTDRESIRLALHAVRARGMVVIHGAVRGSDSIAGEIAQAMGAEVDAFPADWDLEGKTAGPIRNERMLREGKPDRCLAPVDLVAMPSARGAS